MFYLSLVTLVLALGMGQMRHCSYRRSVDIVPAGLWYRWNAFPNRLSAVWLVLFAAVAFGPISPCIAAPIGAETANSAPVFADTVGDWQTQGGAWRSTGDTLNGAVPEGIRAFAVRDDTVLASVQTVTVELTPGERVGMG